MADTLRQTFAQVLASSSIPHRHGPAAQPHASADLAPTGSHKGQSAIFFKPPQVTTLAAPFHWILVGKFSQRYYKSDPKLGCPSLDDLQKYFVSLDMKGEFFIGLLDNRHLLIHLAAEVDYLRLYSQMVWYIIAIMMQVFKWDTNFHVDPESSLVPVWATLLYLLVHFFAKSTLFQITALISSPVHMDAAIESLK